MSVKRQIQRRGSCNPGISTPAPCRQQKHMKTVAESAVDKINEQNRANAESKAIVIIRDIVDLQKRIEGEETNISSIQMQLDKLANSEITLPLVYGRPMPASLNETQKTVAKAIEALVKSKQDCVAGRATELGSQVVSSKKNIESLNEAIAKKRKELDDLKVEVVKEETIIG